VKNFNLEAALAGAPVVTRDGREVQELHFFASCDGLYPVRFVVDRQMYSCAKDGSYHNGYDSPHDLFMKSEKKSQVVYPVKQRYGFAWCGIQADSKALADKEGGILCDPVTITWEE